MGSAKMTPILAWVFLNTYQLEIFELAKGNKMTRTTLVFLTPFNYWRCPTLLGEHDESLNNGVF